MVPGLCFLTLHSLNSWGFTQPAAAGGGKGLLPNVVRAMPQVGLGILRGFAACASGCCTVCCTSCAQDLAGWVQLPPWLQNFAGGTRRGWHTGCTAVLLLTHPTRAPLNDWCVFIVQAALTFLVYETIMKHLAEAQQRPQDQKG